MSLGAELVISKLPVIALVVVIVHLALVIRRVMIVRALVVVDARLVCVSAGAESTTSVTVAVLLLASLLQSFGIALVAVAVLIRLKRSYSNSGRGGSSCGGDGGCRRSKGPCWTLSLSLSWSPSSK